ncbi:hypothetical protein [Algirhabdus cladophorae]|uniref:hypothetical protein n=1 Tax=Algirhabdus cladophorae TaxID=3377108 RepID=UPI003B846E23
MQLVKPVGRGASARKYDLLTALGAYALAHDKHRQRLVLRLMTLVTARYNWQRDELAVGQREIARMWSVDERTVKREMAKLRGMGWLRVKRAGARGRVTEYGLQIDEILQDTATHWPSVGPDFALRMEGTPAPDTNVVPMVPNTHVAAPDLTTGDEWSLAQAVLHQEDPSLYAAWLRGLTRESRAGGRLTLRAPSRFHAAYVQTHLLGQVVAVVQSVDADVVDVILIV